MMKISILIADDYPVVRRGLRTLLESEPGWEVVAEASNGGDAVTYAEQLRPDVVILDVSMPVLDGVDAARLIVKLVPDTRVLVISGHHTEERFADALQAGVRGYLMKSNVETDLIEAVRALIQGRTWFPNEVSEQLLERLRGEKGQSVPALTTREVEIVQLLAEGKSNKEVAHALGISVRTVENHRAQVMQRLGLKTFSSLVRYAIRNGIIEP
jgi:DNA-binding NarL/FixJ family response regulator